MALPFQPVQVPTGSSSIAALTGASESIGAGLSTIGAGLTSLGVRRENRLKEQKANAEAEALEIEKQKLASFTSEEDFANYFAEIAGIGNPSGVSVPGETAVAQGGAAAPSRGAVIPGLADAINSQRTGVIKAEGDRAQTAQTIEQTRGFRVKTDVEQLALDELNATAAIDKEFAADLVEINSFADAGDREKASAAAAALNAKLVDRGYSAKQAAKITENMNTAYGTSLDNTGKELTNDSTIASTAGTRADTARTIQATTIDASEEARRQAQEADDNILRDATREVTLEDIALKNGVQKGLVQYMDGATSRESVLLKIANDPALRAEPEKRMLISKAIDDEFTKNPNILDVINPVTDNQLDAVEVDDGIDDNPAALAAGNQELMDVRQGKFSSAGIFLDAQTEEEKYQAKVAIAGSEIENFDQYAIQRFPKLGANKGDRLRDLKVAARRAGINDFEMLAIIEKQGNVSEDLLKAAFNAYGKTNKGALGADAAQLGYLRKINSENPSKIKSAQAELARIRAAPVIDKTREKELLVDIKEWTAELQGIEGQFSQ